MASVGVPVVAASAVLTPSRPLAAGTATVRGFDFNNPATLDALLGSYVHVGLQSTALGRAIEEVNKMLKWRLSDEPVKEDEDEDMRSPEARARVRCTIFLSYTSNLVSSGVREIIRFLCQHHMVDAIVTTAGGVEEDLMKCIAPHYHGDFAMGGAELRSRGINRIGNILVPNNTYCAFEDWFTPILDAMHTEQERDSSSCVNGGELAQRTIWTPSMIIDRLGKEIGNTESIYYWCHKHRIPVFCPALTDGSIGDMMYFHSYKREGFIVDIAGDIRRINDVALRARRSGMIILGAGVVKHHVCNANLMRNGADYAVFINTASEFDGSDAGARPDEAVSWGKVRVGATPVKVYAEVSLVFPLIVSQTFVKHFEHTPEPVAPTVALREEAGGEH